MALLDGCRAKRVAKAKHIMVTGTVGLLMRGYETGSIDGRSELRGIVNEIAEAGFAIEERVVDRIFASNN